MARARKGTSTQTKLGFLIYGEQGTWKSSMCLEFAKYKREDGKTGTTVKVEADGVTFIKFKVSDDDEILRVCRDWEYDENHAKINVVGRIGMNSFGGTKSKQVTVSAWQLI